MGLRVFQSCASSERPVSACNSLIAGIASVNASENRVTTRFVTWTSLATGWSSVFTSNVFVQGSHIDAECDRVAKGARGVDLSADRCSSLATDEHYVLERERRNY